LSSKLHFPPDRSARLLDETITSQGTDTKLLDEGIGRYVGMNRKGKKYNRLRTAEEAFKSADRYQGIMDIVRKVLHPN
jgi:hypothetical protein